MLYPRPGQLRGVRKVDVSQPAWFPSIARACVVSNAKCLDVRQMVSYTHREGWLQGLKIGIYESMFR